MHASLANFFVHILINKYIYLWVGVLCLLRKTYLYIRPFFPTSTIKQLSEIQFSHNLLKFEYTVYSVCLVIYVFSDKSL